MLVPLKLYSERVCSFRTQRSDFQKKVLSLQTSLSVPVAACCLFEKHLFKSLLCITFQNALFYCFSCGLHCMYCPKRANLRKVYLMVVCLGEKAFINQVFAFEIVCSFLIITIYLHSSVIGGTVSKSIIRAIIFPDSVLT